MNPGIFIRSHSTIKNLIFERKVRRAWKTKVFLWYGPTGCGKSRGALEISPNAYIKSSSTQTWWDGYDGTSDICLDDMKGNAVQYSELLQIMDRYPHQVQYKGGCISFAPKVMHITTTVLPWKWYSEKVHWDSKEFGRRVDIVMSWNEELKEFEELSWSEFSGRFETPAQFVLARSYESV